MEVTACGSFRRGRKTCGDLDLLLTHPQNRFLTNISISNRKTVTVPLHRQEGLLPTLLSALHGKGILTDDLTVPGEAGSHQNKYMGVAR